MTMPRNRANKAVKSTSGNAGSVPATEPTENTAVSPIAAESAAKPIEEKRPLPKSPSSKSLRGCAVLHLYRQAYTLRATLRVVDPKIAKTTDKMLASIGYPARLLFFLFKVTKLKALSNTISDYRTFSRVISTPATLEYALDLLLDNRNPDKLDRYLEYIQAVAGLLYQILEDLAYFGDKKVISIGASRRADLWVWSSIAWAIDVLIEVLKVPYHHYILHRPVSMRKLFVNLAWLPLTYHWSTYNGVFDDGWVGLLGTAACWPNMVYQWKNA